MYFPQSGQEESDLIHRDDPLQSIPKSQLKAMQWTLDNIYTIARRESRRKELRPEMWWHVIRLCEKAGCQSRGVLRDNGGPIPGVVSDEDYAVDPVVEKGQEGPTRDKTSDSDPTYQEALHRPKDKGKML